MAALNYPSDLKYAKSDEWVRVEGDIATLGISDYAQDALNDLTYVEYAVEPGAKVAAGDAVAEVESVKASSEIYSPIAGEILAVNEALKGEEDTINADPYGKGWLVKLRLSDASGLAELMDAAAYQTYCESR
ncbi:MAG: glycine cleavage system protein GcvH [Anaerolineae bacterium]|nr:glycine cleavage system protein GcvH [Anaerolineae bacterium]